MPPRRGVPSSNTLSPLDHTTSSNSFSSGLQPGPRSTSPSGFTQFLTKPSKWFTRSASTPKFSAGSPEPRSSISSSGRKHKISHPTDPRPILDSYSGNGSKSVLDLSSRPQNSLDISIPRPPPSPSAPSSPGLGDLRNISRRGWSKSADDLGKVHSGELTPINTSFQEKVAIYRNRSDSNASGISPSTPSTPVSPASLRQPFPTMMSSSPPNSITSLSGVSISISAPAIEDAPQNGQTSHVHTRSHSFTPRLSSKLATPRFMPPSPKRKGSGSSDRDVEVKDGTSVRGPFPFNFGGHNNKPAPPDPPTNPGAQNLTPVRNPTLLAPPAIVEPSREDGDDSNTKRSSQIVYHSGFINRLSETPNHFHHPNLSLSKGWKPFKLELKGSKLYFYKPPGDRNAAIKELFPTELVPPSPEDDDVESAADDFEGGSGRSRQGKSRDDGTLGRKKRAFWGRRTHPDLTRDADGRIEKGSFEALIHEAVFGTTFENEEGDIRERWKDYSLAILLCLPSLVGREKFEAEFMRCGSYLVSGAEDGAKEEGQSRVGWLAGEYLRFHTQPADLSGWEEWRTETIPDVSAAVVQAQAPTSIPTSSSLQALYVATPTLGHRSPDFGTFSPRPQDCPTHPSLMGAVGDLDSALYSPRKSSVDFRASENQSTYPPYNSSTHLPWATLEREGLSRAVLLSLDPQLISRTLSCFHRSVLEQVPCDLTAESIIGSEHHGDPSSTFSALFGGEEHPHWLTKLLLMQILGADTSGGTGTSPQAPAWAPDDRAPQTSRTHSRSEVISVWARIGELCRLAGDECSWRAIQSALCSRPVARLDKAWKRVDPLALAAIESWVYPGLDGECVSAKEPRVTPWGGDVRSRMQDELGKARSINGDENWAVEPLEKAQQMFEGLRTAFSLCPRKQVVAEDEIGEDVQGMVEFWQKMAAAGGGSGGIASKFMRIEQFMSLSLAAEPRRKGLFEAYHSTQSSFSAPHAPLIPLLFPEPLPTVTLIDRAQLLRGRVDSDAPDQFLRGIDLHARSEDRHARFTPRNITDLSNGGTVIPVYNGDLLLAVQRGGEPGPSSRPSSRAPSRPPSSVIDQSLPDKPLGRTPSIRVKPGSSQGLDRKTSVARRSSLPSISQRPNFVVSEPSMEPPLRVLVQAGTLNCLVNILVHGLQGVSVSVADDNGEMSLREGKTRDLVVDHQDFARVWWSVFRSFVTPIVFFELLRKLYITAQLQGSSPSASEYLRVAASRSEVLRTIKEWLHTGAGAQDALDDVLLYNTIRSFLESATDHLVYESSSFENADVRLAWDALKQERQSLASIFFSQMMRPITRHSPSARAHGLRTHSTNTREAPDIDRIDPGELVDSLDGMVSAAFSNVSDEDLFVTADILEVQTADRTGWFLPRESHLTEDSVEIQTIYSHIQDVTPSPLISELGQDAIYRLLPPGIRSCIRAYGILRKWLISKLVAPRLSLRTRQIRMEMYLQAIEISRLRSPDSESALRLADRPCVRSFVEAVITSAILSVESRMFHRAWHNVAIGRGSHIDTLLSLLANPSTQSVASPDPLIVDMGWLLERILEVITTPNIVDSANPDGQSLINFDKRRQLCNLITNTPSLPLSRRSHQRDDLNRRGFERLNNVEREVSNLQFDWRSIKDEALRETTQSIMNGPPSARKVVRPFHRLVAVQIEKNKRDKNLRARLQKEKLYEQTRNEKRDEVVNKAMRPRKPGPIVPKQHRNKKSMSAFLQFMRPISSAFGADLLAPSSKRTASELDFKPSGKPSLVLSLVDARIIEFINNERSFTFQVDTEDGGHYLLQAMNRRDMAKWTETINRVTKMAAKRRLTYLGSPKPQLSDHIHSHSTTPSRDPTAVFGVELEFLLQREAQSDAVQPGAIPNVIEQCLQEIESRGLSEVGIYRIPGASSEINALKDGFNKGDSPIRRSTDIHAVCDLVKSWFRVLPEPVFPSSSYYGVIDAMKLENLDARLSTIRGVVQSLPQANFDLLKRVSEHLDKVTDYEEYNQMTAEALAIVFSPNLLRAPQNDFAMILANMGQTHKLVKALITHFHVIFDDVDPDGEVDQDDDDFEDPILEEDEDQAEIDDCLNTALPEDSFPEHGLTPTHIN